MKLALRILAVSAALGVCAYASVPLLYGPQRCNSEFTRLLHATRLAEESPSQSDVVARARQNVDDLRPLIALCPRETNLYMLTALNEQLMGRREAAVQTYRRALAFDQRPEIYQALGTVLFELGRREEAIEEWTAAVRFHPQFADEIPSAQIAEEIRSRLPGQRAP